MTANDDDSDLFRHSVKGTRPLHQDKRPVSKRKKAIVGRKPESASQWPSAAAIDSHSLPAVAADTRLFYAKPHLPAKLLRQLRQGKLPIQAKIDLHGMTLNQAEHAIQQFIHRCQQQNKRYGLIIHGKGSRAIDGNAVIKSYVNSHLPYNPNIVAFCSALPKHGGTGAIYVVIKMG